MVVPFIYVGNIKTLLGEGRSAIMVNEPGCCPDLHPSFAVSCCPTGRLTSECT